jgi:23S rRNA (cytosine1962-C5)-methyltransferase
MEQPATVRISRRAAERLQAGHVWVYASDVEDASGARGGEAVHVTAGKGRRLGVAHYSSNSQIALRLLDRGAPAIDAAFFRARIAAALAHRAHLRVVRATPTAATPAPPAEVLAAGFGALHVPLSSAPPAELLAAGSGALHVPLSSAPPAEVLAAGSGALHVPLSSAPPAEVLATGSGAPHVPLSSAPPAELLAAGSGAPHVPLSSAPPAARQTAARAALPFLEGGSVPADVAENGEQDTAYRLVFAEGDFLPGLIVDRYGPVLVMQNLTQGMEAAKPFLIEALVAETGATAIWERNDAAVRAKEGLPLVSGPLYGDPPQAVDVWMNGLRFRADIAAGQKTGVYLDQRENYLAAARWARGRALDCFTSTGGFALHMARGCERVEAVDSGAAALAAARANAAANGIGNIDFREADVFHLLAGYATAGRRFQTIVLDPPAFAKSKASIDGALRGYREINRRAMELLEPGGVLVTCSCSHHVSEGMLAETVAQAGLEARRTVRILERRLQASDHPVLLTVPETLYLKCLILEVLPG